MHRSTFVEMRKLLLLTERKPKNRDQLLPYPSSNADKPKDCFCAGNERAFAKCLNRVISYGEFILFDLCKNRLHVFWKCIWESPLGDEQIA